ncbi:MAG: uridylate kinase [Planctomycetota bacterium]|jgi:uridylate kinase
MTDLVHKRILVKLSGEALLGSQNSGIDAKIVDKLTLELKGLQQSGVELGVVIGGGNIFRGAGLAAAGLDRVTGDQMGMLATVMNALALQDSLARHQASSAVMSGLDMPQVCDRYSQRDARRRIANGEIIIFAGGTGNPYFTTDTGASLRAIEIQADLLIKATQVDGIYDRDPNKYDDAVRYESLDYDLAIDKRLAVMDLSAMILCKDNGLDLVVCDINDQGALLKLAQGQSIGTRVSSTVRNNND